MSARLDGWKMIVALVVGGYLAAPGSLPAADPPFELRAEPSPFLSGKPLSKRALVQEPGEVHGAVSWTVETRLHRGILYAASVSPDAKHIATTGLDGTLRVWDVTSGKLLRAMVGHDTYVTDIAWHPSMPLLATTGTHDGTIRLWSLRNSHLLRTFKGLRLPVTRLAWSPDGKRLLATGGRDGWTWVWDGPKDDATKLSDLGQVTASLTWSPDSRRAAYCGGQLPVTLVDMSGSEPTKTLTEVAETFTNLAWSPDGKLIACGSPDSIALWDPQANKIAKSFKGSCLGSAWSPDGKLLVGATGSYLQLYEVESGKMLHQVVVPTYRLSWHAASNQIFVVGPTTVSIWIVEKGKLAKVHELTLAGTSAPLWTQNRPIVTGLGSNTLALWDYTSAKFQRDLAGHTSVVYAASWSREGKSLATASADKTVRLWDVRSGQATATLEGHKAAVLAVAYAPDGRSLASAGSDNTVRVWNAAGECEQTLTGHTKPIRALAWASNGSTLASGGDDANVIVWNADSGKQLKSIRASSGVQSLAFTTLQKTPALAIGTADETVGIHNAGTGQLMTVVRQNGSPPNVAAMAWAPSGSLLLAGRGCHQVLLWDTFSTKVVATLATYAAVQHVAWAANGGAIVAASADRTVRFWDAKGEARGTIVGQPEQVVLIGIDGHVRMDVDRPETIVYVAQTDEGQLTLSPEAFAERFRWRNNPSKVKLLPR